MLTCPPVASMNVWLQQRKGASSADAMTGSSKWHTKAVQFVEKELSGREERERREGHRRERALCVMCDGDESTMLLRR